MYFCISGNIYAQYLIDPGVGGGWRELPQRSLSRWGQGALPSVQLAPRRPPSLLHPRNPTPVEDAAEVGRVMKTVG